MSSSSRYKGKKQRTSVPRLVGFVVVSLLLFFLSRTYAESDPTDPPQSEQSESTRETSTSVAVLESRATEPSAPVETGRADGTSTFEAASNLPLVKVADLPPEAWDTLELIAQGGPYPFRNDDGTFQNREGILPDESREYYREYTVITPGEDDRGARRIVAGDNGELYYTADHYASFSEIAYS